jgi:hypothetical protein
MEIYFRRIRFSRDWTYKKEMKLTSKLKCHHVSHIHFLFLRDESEERYTFVNQMSKLTFNLIFCMLTSRFSVEFC